MAGEEFSSTDLHLANGDSLLVGQVAELKQIDPNDPQATAHFRHRKLQASRSPPVNDFGGICIGKLLGEFHRVPLIALLFPNTGIGDDFPVRILIFPITGQKVGQKQHF